MTIYSLVDLGLFAALVVTSASVLLVYFRLKALTRALGEYRTVFEATAGSLEKAATAVDLLNADSRALVAALIARTSEANGVLAGLTRESRRLELVKVTPLHATYRGRDRGSLAIES